MTPEDEKRLCERLTRYLAGNAIAYFHDGIGICTHGTPDARPEDWAVAIDIYNNDIHLTADDFIEADGGVHNIRVFGNRGVNSAHACLSGQPIFGGPAYYYRNVMYHIQVGSPFKFYARCAGVLAYHNTAIADLRIADPFSNAHFRNNLFLGSDRPNAPIVSVLNATAYSSYDHNGYRRNRGVEANFVWASPAAGVLRDDGLTLTQHARKFGSLAEWSKATGQESHGVELDYDAFENLVPPDVLNDPLKIFHASDLNFALRPGGKAIDAGVVLPTINDDYRGSGPDLGALERGAPGPTYGPRWLKPTDVFYR